MPTAPPVMAVTGPPTAAPSAPMASLVKALPVTVAVPRVMLLASLAAWGRSSMICTDRLPVPVTSFTSFTARAMSSVDSVAPGWFCAVFRV